MKKAEFLAESKAFITWLANHINGPNELRFAHGTGTDRYLPDALGRYKWPHKRTSIPMPSGMALLPRNSGYAANQQILRRLSKGLRNCLGKRNHIQLAAWARATMVWGGVYSQRASGKGNTGWLNGQQATFAAHMNRTIKVLREGDDESPRGMFDLRSNAGTTRIHSLILPRFVIYDSRVAAALAWLVYSWARENKATIPSHLRFACMRANTNADRGKRRTPNEDVFPYFAPSGHQRNHHKHATWNLRANWIVGAALRQARRGRKSIRWTFRKVEAALFMVGEDLSRALSTEQADPG